MKITDEEEILDVCDAWHEGRAEGEEIYDALGWTWEEYKLWVETSIVPSP